MNRISRFPRMVTNGDVIICQGTKATVTEILSSEYYPDMNYMDGLRSVDKDKSAIFLEFKDKMGRYRSWKSEIDGGKVDYLLSVTVAEACGEEVSQDIDCTLQNYGDDFAKVLRRYGVLRDLWLEVSPDGTLVCRVVFLKKGDDDDFDEFYKASNLFTWSGETGLFDLGLNFKDLNEYDVKEIKSITGNLIRSVSYYRVDFSVEMVEISRHNVIEVDMLPRLYFKDFVKKGAAVPSSESRLVLGYVEKSEFLEE